MQLFFKRKSNISYIAGVMYKNILYYSSYNFGGIWKLNIADGKTEMIAIIQDNRKHEFAFRINEQIWFIPAYQEKNVFDVLDINSGKVKSIPLMPLKNEMTMKRKYSDYIEFDNEIWVMPSTLEYIVVIEKDNEKLRYIMLSDMKLDATDNDFVGAVNVGRTIYMYEKTRNRIVKIDTEIKEASYLYLKEQICEYRNILKCGKFLYIVPQNINGNGILKYDLEKNAVIEKTVIVNNTNKGALICTGSVLMGKSIFFLPYNFNKVIKWRIDGEIEWIDINCIQDKTFQKLCYWDAVKAERGFLFGIEEYGAPIIYIRDDESVMLIESRADELKDGLLNVLL